MNWLLNKTKGDFIIWMVILVLSLFSLIAVYSATGSLAYKAQGGNTEYFFFKHLILLTFGLVIIYLCHLINFRYYSRIAQILLILSIPLLILTYFLGLDVNQAKRWLVVPGINLTFQTSNVAKLALIMFIARILSKKQSHIKDFKQTFLPVMGATIGICGLIAPADFSTSAVLFTSSLILMFIGRVNLKYLGMLILIAVVGISSYIGVVSTTSIESRVGTWEERVESFMNDKQGSYQSKQAKIAVASGGLIGQGPGNSTQRNFLPNPYSDFIYAIIIEEWGLIGGVFIIFLYLILLYRSLIIVVKSPQTFGALLALGLSLSLVLQAMINMGVAVHLFPVTGLPLPMVSMGGTSLWFTSIALGIILSVSRYIEEGEESLETQNANSQKVEAE